MTIEFRDITKTFVQQRAKGTKVIHAVSGITLRIDKGEFFSIIGPSGCGKSTLLNLLAGLEKPDGGEVLVDGVPVREPGPERAVVFQEAGLMPWMTVSKNVEYGLRLRRMPKRQAHEHAKTFLKLVHLSKYSNALPHQLSGGMKQRVSIARALALEPQVLLMDEPFSALDAQTRDVLHDELQRIWQETQTTIIFVTHNIREAVYLSGRVMIMTAAPGTVKKVVKIPFAHPRVKSSPELGYYTAQLHNLIKSEVDKVAARELDADWQPELAAQTPEAAVEDLGSGI
jgi:NitT/TauT family transport system ATP-binding protein